MLKVAPDISQPRALERLPGSVGLPYHRHLGRFGQTEVGQSVPSGGYNPASR